DTFRPNPDFSSATAITELGTGEALVSLLEAKGIPSVVQRTLIRPPSARMGPLTDGERQRILATSPVAGHYDEAVDRESAFEMLQKKAEESARAAEEAVATGNRDTKGGPWTIPDFGGDHRGRDDEFADG